MKWVADNSEAFSHWETPIPDVLLIGGFVGDEDQLNCLQENLIQIKFEYSEDPSFPLKWNFKDLKKHFKKIDRLDLYKSLLGESDNWRTAMAQSIVECEVCLVVSCLLCKGLCRDALKATRDDLTSAAFSNGLQRFAMHAKEESSSVAEVILDWPDKGQPGPFNDEYEAAFYSGMSLSGVNYHSGPLSTLGFSDAVNYCTMTSSGLLQLADLVVGTSREFVDVVEGRKKVGLGMELFKTMAPRFRGYPNDIVGRGFVISPSRSPLAKSIQHGFDKYL